MIKKIIILGLIALTIPVLGKLKPRLEKLMGGGIADLAGLYRYEDKEVICFIFQAPSRGGVSCFLKSEIKGKL